MASWRLTPARAGTRDPFVVSFPAALDHGLLARALSVQAADGTSIDGDMTLESGDTRWAFRPRVPWQSGEYQLVAQSILEDPAGNRIGRPFEVDMTKPAGAAPPETFRTSFRIVGAGL